MKKRFTAGLMLGALAMAALPATVSADPEGACLNDESWTLERFQLTWPGVDRGDLVDHNRDGFGCYRMTRETDWDGLGGLIEIFVWRDNDEPLST